MNFFLAAKIQAEAMIEQAEEGRNLWPSPCANNTSVQLPGLPRNMVHCPKTQTEIYQEIFKLLIDRSAEKDDSVKDLDKDSLDDLLDILGEASWEALQKDTGELLLNKVNIFVTIYSS